MQETSFHGRPCWYELGTSDLEAAGRFYGGIFGWEVADSGMQDFAYHLARTGEGNVAGLMSNAGQAGNPPPNWLIYFAVDDCARTVADIEAAGGSILKQPQMIPGTGLYAVVADPQGAVFGLIQPDLDQMSEEDRIKARSGKGGAFDQGLAGHAHWNELMTSDPEAGFAFYSQLFGWTRGQAMDMGEMGVYQLFRYRDADIGAIMGLGNSPMPAWLPYFGVRASVRQCVSDIEAAGGKIHFGPGEVPGPAYIAVGQDPQGAWFALVGPQA